jgi:hypothetical protein
VVILAPGVRCFSQSSAEPSCCRALSRVRGRDAQSQIWHTHLLLRSARVARCAARGGLRGGRAALHLPRGCICSLRPLAPARHLRLTNTYHPRPLFAHPQPCSSTRRSAGTMCKVEWHASAACARLCGVWSSSSSPGQELHASAACARLCGVQQLHAKLGGGVWGRARVPRWRPGRPPTAAAPRAAPPARQLPPPLPLQCAARPHAAPGSPPRPPCAARDLVTSVQQEKSKRAA